MINQCTRDNGKTERETAGERWSGGMGVCMRDFGSMVKPVAMDDSYTRMEMSTKVNERMIRHLVKASTYILKVPSMKEAGIMINNQEMEGKFGQMVQSIKDNIMKVLNMVTEDLSGQTAPVMRATSSQTESRERVSTPGQIIACTKDSGRTTKWKAMVPSSGPMGESTLGNTNWIKNMERESFSGVKAKSSPEHGNKVGL